MNPVLMMSACHPSRLVPFGLRHPVDDSAAANDGAAIQAMEAYRMAMQLEERGDLPEARKALVEAARIKRETPLTDKDFQRALKYWGNFRNQR